MTIKNTKTFDVDASGNVPVSVDGAVFVANEDRDTNLDGLVGLLTNAMLFGRVSDSIVKGVRIDASTEAMMTIGYGHHEVHAGSHYYYRDHYTLARAATKEFIIVTPDTTTWAHMVIGIEATTSTIDVALYEDAVTTDDGTAEPVINRNRNSAKVNGTLLFEDPTLTADGTEISSGIFGAGRNSNGGGGRDTEEVVLKQNTKYLLRITEQNIQATSINIILDWYEHTDRN